MNTNFPVIKLTQELISKESVTPEDKGAIDVVVKRLEKLGFKNKLLPFGNSRNGSKVLNLFAVSKKSNKKILCFAGHTDVVPTGNVGAWKHKPFAGKISNSRIYGRGASDMKGAIAAWICACENVVLKNKMNIALAMLITGDEEGIAKNGTKKVVEWLKKSKTHLDHCLVGEPTNPLKIGEMVKVGRRGSLSLVIEIKGQAGHVAYPQFAINPHKTLIKICDGLIKLKLHKKAEKFPVSNLEITSIDTGNKITNVIPDSTKIRLNIRYNTAYNEANLIAAITKICKKNTKNYKIKIISSNHPFFTKNSSFTDLLIKAIKKNTKTKTVLSTTGGTSDARFIKDLCPVIEFGGVGQTMHKINENMRLKDLLLLQKIYEDFIVYYNDFYK